MGGDEGHGSNDSGTPEFDNRCGLSDWLGGVGGCGLERTTGNGLALKEGVVKYVGQRGCGL